MIRNAEEIAIRAILSGTLGVRASLEVTGQPRASSLCSQLLLWLERVARIAGIAPFHRAILETPHRGLSREMLVEAYWRGEEASLLG